MLNPLVRLVDDDEDLIRANAFILQINNFEVAQFSSTEEFLAKDDTQRPGCIFLDIRMEGMSGLECLQELKRRNPDLPIAFITGYAEVETAVWALKSGACEFLQKPVTAEKLVKTCKTLVEWNVQKRLEKISKEKACERLASLSLREKEVAKLVAQGYSNKKIAQLLQVSEQNIKIHRSNIYKKLEIHSAVKIYELFELCSVPADDLLRTVKVISPENL